MMQCVLQGDTSRIVAIWFPGTDGGSVEVGGFPRQAEAITVVSVAGQGGYLPWFESLFNDGSRTRYNAAYVEAVVYDNSGNLVRDGDG